MRLDHALEISDLPQGILDPKTSQRLRRNTTFENFFAN